MIESLAEMQTVGLVVNSERAGAIAYAQELRQWMEVQGLRVCATRNVTSADPEGDLAYDELVRKSDLLIVLGGDGTLLGASRRAAPHSKPILGIHWGGMGFLNECQPDQARDAVTRIREGRYRVEERLMLCAELRTEERGCSRCLALNDVTVTRDTLSRILKLEVIVGDEPAASFQGDGVVIATPTGSTGHSLSAGGPILDPRVCALTVTPICPHSLSGRALVVPAQERLRIRHSSPLANITVTLDGQVGMPMCQEDQLEVTLAPQPARFVRLGYNRFYSILRDKLHWRL